MLRTIEEWTSGHYLLEAVDASSPNTGCEFIYMSSQKKWASRVIHDKKITLTFDELVDFIGTTKYKTYSYFKIKTDETKILRMYFLFIAEIVLLTKAMLSDR
jgi:hypothetical protein